MNGKKFEQIKSWPLFISQKISQLSLGGTEKKNTEISLWTLELKPEGSE
jgi:hypothetical protein